MRIGDADHGRLARARLGIEFHYGGGDDAERPLRAHEKMLQVVARVVLLELRQRRHDPAIGQHDLDARHEIAGVAIGDDSRAAGVGRQIAAYGARAFRGERQRKQPVLRVRGLLQAQQGHARFDRHGVRRRIDLAHLVHAVERQHDLRAAFIGRLAANEAGVAALRHDRRVGLVADLENRRDLRGRARPHDARRLAEPQVALLDEIGVHVARVGQHVAFANDGGETLDEIGGRGMGVQGSVHGPSLLDWRASREWGRGSRRLLFRERSLSQPRRGRV